MEQPTGVLVLGLSPHLPFDDRYRGFCDLVARQVSTAIASARAYETERNRVQALEELDRAKSAFFSNVSHEFRTPLTLMMAQVEAMLASSNDTFTLTREDLSFAYRNNLRLLKLVNTLLELSRIKGGKRQLNCEATDLPTFTADIVSTFRSAIEAAGLTLAVESPPLPVPVQIDRDMWENIVLNLVSNAFKFTFEGGLTASLRQEGSMVAIGSGHRNWHRGGRVASHLQSFSSH